LCSSLTLWLAEHIPPKARQQFFTKHAGRFLNQRAMLGRERSLEIDPLMNADRRHLEDASEGGLAAGDIACPSEGIVSFFLVHAALLGVA